MFRITDRKSFLSAVLIAGLFVGGCSGQDGSDGKQGEPGQGAEGAQGAQGAQGEAGEPASTPIVVSPQDMVRHVAHHEVKGTYVQLSQEWWQWAYSMPKAGHPLAGGTDCSAGQAGSVWFLGGAFEPGTFTRSCTVPAGKALFFPIVNVAYNNLDEDPPKTDAELHQLASFYGSAATDMSAEIDGVAVTPISDYHVHSNVFSIWWPDAPVFDDTALGGETEAVTDGYYLMINPLPAGTHTVKFKGSLVFTTAVHGFDHTFALDVTYNLTVQ